MLYRLASLAVLLALAVTVSGCGVSLLGKRRYEVSSKQSAWQLGLVTVRGMDERGGRYLLALYDDELPNSGLTLLQLWGARSKEE